MPSSSLRLHAIVLDAYGFGVFWNTKANRHKIKMEPIENDRPLQVNDYAKETSQFHTHKRPYKKNFLAHNGVGAVWNGKPKWDGPCKWRRLPAALPFPQVKTAEWLICMSAKAADQQILCRKSFQAKLIFYFRWFDPYTMRKISRIIISQFHFVFLCAPEPLKAQSFGAFWTIKTNWDKIKKESG